MSIITDEMVEKAFGILGALPAVRVGIEAVVDEIIETCAVELEKNGTTILHFYDRGPNNPPGNAMVPFSGKHAADHIRSLKSKP